MKVKKYEYKTKTLEEIKEGKVKFGKKALDIPFSKKFKDELEMYHAFNDALLKAGKGNLRIESTTYAVNDLKNQEKSWKELIKIFAGDDAKKFVSNILDMTPFPGQEILLNLTGDKRLLKMSNFDKESETFLDMAITSYVYGGARLKLWKQYMNLKVEDIILGFGNYLESSFSGFGEESTVRKEDGLLVIDFNSDSEKDVVVEAFEALASDFTIEIDEEYEEMTWHVTIK